MSDFDLSEGAAPISPRAQAWLQASIDEEKRKRAEREAKRAEQDAARDQRKANNIRLMPSLAAVGRQDDDGSDFSLAGAAPVRMTPQQQNATTPLEMMNAQQDAAVDPMEVIYAQASQGQRGQAPAAAPQPDFYQAMGGSRPSGPAPASPASLNPGIGTTQQIAPLSMEGASDPTASVPMDGHAQAADEMAKMDAMIDEIRPRTKEEKMNNFLAAAFLGMAASKNPNFVGALGEGAYGAYGMGRKDDQEDRQSTRDKVKLKMGVGEYGQRERELESSDNYRKDSLRVREASAGAGGTESRREREWASKTLADTELKDVQNQLKELDKQPLDPKEKAATRAALVQQRKGIIKKMSDIRYGRVAPDVVSDATDAVAAPNVVDYKEYFK